MVLARTLAVVFFLLVGSADVLASEGAPSEVSADEGASHSILIEADRISELERQLEEVQLIVERQQQENRRLKALIQETDDAERRKRAFETLAKGGLVKQESKDE